MNEIPKNISSTDTHTAASRPIRMLLAAGGTGGHVYPAISIANAVRELEPDSIILFAGTRDRMEWETVPGYGYEIRPIWISGLHRRFTFKNLLFPLKLIVSLVQSYKIIRSFRPDIVMACGGFVSGPIGWVAGRLKLPLVLQEQNSYPGVTTRLLASDARIIFTAFEEASQNLPSEKIRLTGNPVRKKDGHSVTANSLNLNDGLKTILILGGSGGAWALNEAVLSNLDELHNHLGLQIVWQCGEKYYDDLMTRLDLSNYPNLRIRAYLDDILSIYEKSHLVITRAGAGTCSELMNLGQPAVLVPSPNVAGDHQTKNAIALEKSGAAALLKEEEMETTLVSIVRDIISDQKKLQSMQKQMLKLAKPNAAEMIASEVIELARGGTL